MRSIRGLLAALFGLGFTAPALAAPYAPQIGQRHVDFTLPDIQTGKPVSLFDYRGRRVLLIQFASW